MISDIPVFVIGIVDTRPGGRGESYLVWKRSDTIKAIINHPLFSEFKSLPKLEEVAKKVKRGDVVEYPKGVFIGLSQFYFFDEDREKYCSESSGSKVPTPKKKPKAKISTKKSLPKLAIRGGPKVTKTDKGVFLVSKVNEGHLKKLRKGVKAMKGGVRKLPQKDDYVVTIPKGGTIKGLKEMLV